MAEKKLPSKGKKYKFPKSMGVCADKLFDLREKRLAAQKTADAIKAEETALTNHIIDNLPKGDKGAIGKHHQVRVITEDIPKVDDWDAFYKYVKRYSAFDLLQRRLSTKAVQERLDDGKKVSGVGKFTNVKVSLTKAG